MTDFELTVFLGLQDLRPATALRLVRTFTPERRAVFEKMKAVELWDQGKGPLPAGVIVCGKAK